MMEEKYFLEYDYYNTFESIDEVVKIELAATNHQDAIKEAKSKLAEILVLKEEAFEIAKATMKHPPQSPLQNGPFRARVVLELASLADEIIKFKK